MMIQQNKLKTGIELSELCSNMIKILCGGNLVWDMDRLMNFSLYCNQLIIQANITSPAIVYTGLKYFQMTLVNSVNEYDIIDLSDIANEYSLFTVSLLLAYKFLEDNPPNMKHWSFISLIPLNELKSLECFMLQKLNYSLSISSQVLDKWVDECNTLSELSYNIDFTNITSTINSIPFDLHMTNYRFGYNLLLPVLLLDDFNFPQQPQPEQQIYYNNQDLLLFDYFDNNTCYFNHTITQDHSYQNNNNHWLHQQQVPLLMDNLWYLTNQSVLF